MREILFRGKQVDNGEWVEGDFCHPCNIVFEAMGYDEVLGQKDVPVINDYAVIPETAGQYTGLTDKNGTKIFEGDICRITRHCILCYGSITFKKGSFWFDEFNTDSVLELNKLEINNFEIKIIGNIHDNPELLKGGAE